jgi:predicted nucleic acid-binding protein
MGVWAVPRCTIVRLVDTICNLQRPGRVTQSRVARRVLESRDLALSTQVIQEFYIQATRSGRATLPTHAQVIGLIQSFMRYPIQEISMAVVRLAVATREKYQLSYWDAAIIEDARVMKCDTVLSEDLSHGEDYGGVRVVNPFA